MVDLERLRDNLRHIRRGQGLTFAKLAECQYVMEVLGDLPLRVAYERLAGMVRMLGEDVRVLQASIGSVLTLSSCTSAT